MSCNVNTLLSQAATNGFFALQDRDLRISILQLLCSGGAGSVQLVSRFASVATSGTGATPLYSDSIPANTLSADGQRIIGEYVAAASYGGVGYNATTNFSFAGQTVFNDVIALANPANYDFSVIVTRTSSTTARVTVTMNREYAAAAPSQLVTVTTTDLAGINWANANNLVFTGTSSNAAQTVTALQSFLEVLR